jgi:hypothetical protein
MSGGDIRNVQEAVLVFVLLIYRAHEGSSRWQDLIDEDEDSLLRRQLDALADHVDELADGEVGGYQVLLLIDGCNVRLLDLLANNLRTVSWLATDMEMDACEANVRECGRCTSGECARPRPCASQTGARP